MHALREPHACMCVPHACIVCASCIHSGSVGLMCALCVPHAYIVAVCASCVHCVSFYAGLITEV